MDKQACSRGALLPSRPNLNAKENNVVAHRHFPQLLYHGRRVHGELGLGPHAHRTRGVQLLAGRPQTCWREHGWTALRRCAHWLGACRGCPRQADGERRRRSVVVSLCRHQWFACVSLLLLSRFTPSPSRPRTLGVLFCHKHGNVHDLGGCNEPLGDLEDRRHVRDARAKALLKITEEERRGLCRHAAHGAKRSH